MLPEVSYQPGTTEAFKQKALQWASSHTVACYFDSNKYADPYSSFDVLIAAGSTEEISASVGTAFDQLQRFLDKNSDRWALGFLTYDLKNELEDLSSSNYDGLQFPELFFFIPETLIRIKGDEIKIIADAADSVYHQILQIDLADFAVGFTREIKQRFSRADYMETVEKIKEHIHRGDCYELNFCQEFYAEDAVINPVAAFTKLNAISPTPFANFFKYYDHYIISATPERFLSKRGTKLISQPIKGTINRVENEQEDEQSKITLRNDAKEQAENVMIVDLVRNDLTRSAVPGTVRVEELFGIYSFKQVHQMISTVVCQANPALSNTELLKNAFPMGSMTGAPKIRAMQLIEDYERTKRGVFSGAVGYFSPNGDFDFNVIIRTLLYNRANRYLSFQAGSAITAEAEAEKEYEECLLKAKAIRNILQ